MEQGEDDGEAEEFYRNFTAKLRAVDDLANIVLKGHLIVEQDIDEIIAGYFFQPQYLLEDRTLGFERKVRLLRAVAYLNRDHQDWELLLLYNSLRNEIAHKGDGPKRKAKLDRIRAFILDGADPGHPIDSDDEELVIFAAARCSGFLAFISDNLIQVRWYIEHLLEALKEGRGFTLATKDDVPPAP